MKNSEFPGEFISRLPYSPSVERTIAGLPPGDPVASATIVQRILEIHPEYGGGLGGKLLEVLNRPVKGSGKRQAVQEWIRDVSALFDPDRVDVLHGRLLILGLGRLDANLAGRLKEFGLEEEIKKELKEPFGSLLLARRQDAFQEKSDDAATASRSPDRPAQVDPVRSFIELVNNEDKARTKGFVVLVHGGPDLESLESACFRQHWNTCLTARYRLHGENAPDDLKSFIVSDLRAIAEGRDDFIGILRPDSDGFKRLASSPLFSSLLSGDPNRIDANLMTQFLHSLADESILGVGQRLILFCEVYGMPQDATLADLGLTTQNLRILEKQPERFGIVISGVPDSIVPPDFGPYFQVLSIPISELESHAQAFSNDSPLGPDQLAIQDEVNALAETIALEKMTPPLVVGILGGWGWGKSFVLHLIEERLRDIRSEPLHPATGKRGEENREFPYIGHPYVIRFDAWTYAKSSLWASLMQTILLELNRQIGIEQTVRSVLQEQDDFESKEREQDEFESKEPAVWRMLTELSDRQLSELRDTPLGQLALKASSKCKTGEFSADKLWSRFEELRDEERKKLLESETSLAEKRQQLEAALLDLEREVDKEIDAMARKGAWVPIKEELLAVFGGDLVSRLQEQAGADGLPSIKEIKNLLGLPEKLKLGFNVYTLAFAGFALVSGLIPFLFKMDIMQKFAGEIASVLSLLLGYLQNLRSAQNWLEQKHSKYQTIVQTMQERFEVQREQLRRKALSDQMETYRKQQEAEAQGTLRSDRPDGTRAKIPQLQESIRSLEAEVEELRRNVGITAEYTSLLDFVKGRLDSGYYDEKLGEMNQVQKDLQDLTDALLSTNQNHDNLFSRGMPRIILFVDDLDRCPPKRVVEVLEAAQLLVKTRLFVIVLAIDVRYITRALEKEYSHVLIRNGEPSGLDYIEKIIQVPYRVRPIQPTAMKNYLKSNMEIAVKGPEPPKIEPKLATEVAEAAVAARPEQLQPADAEIQSGPVGDAGIAGKSSPDQTTHRSIQALPTRIVAFEQEELELLSECCNAVVVSPRSAKRLINVFKLLKIIWDRRRLGTGPADDVKRAMLMLLALSARHPEVLRVLLRDLEEAFRGKSPQPSRKVSLFLMERCRKEAQGAIHPLEWLRVRKLMANKKFFPADLTLKNMSLENIRLVSSFSFVAETDQERERAARYQHDEVGDEM